MSVQGVEEGERERERNRVGEKKKKKDTHMTVQKILTCSTSKFSSNPEVLSHEMMFNFAKHEFEPHLFEVSVGEQLS